MMSMITPIGSSNFLRKPLDLWNKQYFWNQGEYLGCWSSNCVGVPKNFTLRRDELSNEGSSNHNALCVL